MQAVMQVYSHAVISMTNLKMLVEIVDQNIWVYTKHVNLQLAHHLGPNSHRRVCVCVCVCVCVYIIYSHTVISMTYTICTDLRTPVKILD